MILKLKKINFLLPLFFFTQTSFVLANNANTIKNIEIKNNQRVDTSVIDNYLTMQENSLYTPDELNNSIKALYSTGLFERVDIDYKNGNNY